jgi:hypothetical protein
LAASSSGLWRIFFGIIFAGLGQEALDAFYGLFFGHNVTIGLIFFGFDVF